MLSQTLTRTNSSLKAAGSETFRRGLRCAGLLLFCFLLGASGRSQTPTVPPSPAAAAPPAAPPTPYIGEAEAQAHLTKHPNPTYPETAAEQNIAGTVVLRVTINQNGQVAHIYPVSGPELLITPAAEAVRKWLYQPFEVEGKAASVHTIVHVPFGELAAAAEQQRLLADYRPLGKGCTEAILANTDRQLEACRTASATAAQFTSGTRPVERRGSAQGYAIALIRAGSYGQAAAWAEKALPLYAEPPPDPAALAATTLLLAQARAASGDLAGAAHVLASAESSLHESLAAAPNPQLRGLYSKALHSCLQFHASLLTLLRDPGGAQGKLHEADSL